MKEPLFPGIVILSLLILLLVLLLRKLRQPYFIAYIFSGVLVGPGVLNIVQQSEGISQIGELGIILLMFFTGAEINLPALAKNFIKPLFAAISQVLLSLAFIWVLGMYMDWDYKLIVLTGFVISLSSSAIIFQYLSRNGEINSNLGLLTSGVLLIQDLLIVPMLLTLNFISNGNVEITKLIKVSVGALLAGLFMYAAIRRKLFKIPFTSDVDTDHDLQVFIGFTLCFGMAWITYWLELSAALGAFIAGILIGQDKSTRWLDHAMIPFRVFFLAFFFIAVGLQIDVTFFYKNALTVFTIALGALLINSLINVLIFRFTGNSWRDSMYAGALLSQIGEFSFILVTVSFKLGIVGSYAYQITLSVIALTMILTNIWIYIIQHFIYKLPKWKQTLPRLQKGKTSHD